METFTSSRPHSQHSLKIADFSSSTGPSGIRIPPHRSRAPAPTTSASSDRVSLISTAESIHRKSSKRQRASRSTAGDNENNGSGSDRDPSLNKQREVEGDEEDRTLACPFFRRNPIRHMDCLNRKLSRIRDIRQHILRRHKLPTNYCPTCYQTFSTVRARDIHIRSRTCERRNTTPDDFIDDFTEELLNRRVKRQAGVENQWFSIWDALFPDEPRPEDPYGPFLRSIAEEIMGVMRNFWKAEFPDFVREYLREQYLDHGQVDYISVLFLNMMDALQVRFNERLQEATPFMNLTRQIPRRRSTATITATATAATASENLLAHTPAVSIFGSSVASEHYSSGAQNQLCQHSNPIPSENALSNREDTSPIWTLTEDSSLNEIPCIQFIGDQQSLTPGGTLYRFNQGDETVQSSEEWTSLSTTHNSTDFELEFPQNFM
jgi:hypothetical protein